MHEWIGAIVLRNCNKFETKSDLMSFYIHEKKKMKTSTTMEADNRDKNVGKELERIVTQCDQIGRFLNLLATNLFTKVA